MLTRRNVLAAAPATVVAGAAINNTASAASPLPQLEFPTPDAHVRASIKILARS